MTAPIVDVQNLSVIFGDFFAVRDVSFRVAPGEIFGFLGANGAGKTTTIRVLCGLLPGSRGRVIIDGAEFVAGRENIIKQKVGYMSQRFTLYDGLSVKENFDFAASLRGLGRAEYLANRGRLLNFIGFDEDLNTVVKDLPGGIKQEVALCVSLLHDPKIIFLDEPTAGVAPVARNRFWRLIKDLAAAGKTVFVTTHYMDEAENCNRIALMRAGELIAVDTPAALKRATFGDSLYNFTPRGNVRMLAPAPDMEICEPYGRHWHVKFKDGVNATAALRRYKSDFDIEKIQPSLEDVFIRLVEGQNR
ncbi:MAG: ABC transporter ATP-binding protein [Alphaproteobacteria bacterium]|nr:ABC transporter ATP-binding protein [Alphaproteobacteria bacterium]